MKEAEIERRRRHIGAGEHRMGLAAVMGLVIEEMQHGKIHRQGDLLAVGHAGVTKPAVKPLLWRLGHQPQDTMILDLAR